MIIYGIERLEAYSSLEAPIWEAAGAGQFTLTDNEPVVLETPITPLREGNVRLEKLFRSILDAAETSIIPASLAILGRRRAPVCREGPDEIIEEPWRVKDDIVREHGNDGC